MRFTSHTCPIRSYRPQLVTLEERLPLGDGVLGLLVGAALLPTAPAFAAVAEPASERGVSTPWFAPVAGGFTPPARRGEMLADAFSGNDDAASAWAALPASAQRQSDALVSPQRQQGVEPQPSLALRVNESGPAPVPLPSLPAVGVAVPRADDALLSILTGLRQPATTAAPSVAPTQGAQVKERFGKLPAAFEQNVGQTDASVHYFTRGPGYGLFLTSTEAVMVLNQPTKAAEGVEGAMLSRPCAGGLPLPDCLGRESMPPAETAQEPPAVVRMQLIGANATPAVTGRDQQPGKVNYFLGNDPTQWRTNVATFGRVEYAGVYPGIDLVWHGSQQQLEYDFVVSPGADPSVIRLNFAGADRVELDAAGDLLVTAGGQTLRQHRPFVYQEASDTRQEVVSRFVLFGAASGVASAPRAYEVGFIVGTYDAALPLVIDPVLSYSTYLGGSSDDRSFALAMDPASGDALLVGDTSSLDFPTADPLQPSCAGFFCGDVFVTRLRADGAALVFSTYLGGSGGESGHGIAVDPASGDVLLTGNTNSLNFPTANPLQASNRGNGDGFVTRLNAAGSALVFSTYLGGSAFDGGLALAVDPATGDALLTGFTVSINFPTANPLQPTIGGVCNPLCSLDAFVTRLRADGAALVYSTYLGGSSRDGDPDLAVDLATGEALVTGFTYSTDFPTANPLQATLRGLSDAFVARLRADGAGLVFSTYLGGRSVENEGGGSIAVDPTTGDALVTGTTGSDNFPTANPFQPALGGGLSDAFVARLSAAGTTLVSSSYLGGSEYDRGLGVAVDPLTGDALLTGYTVSTDFPTAHPVQPALGGGICPPGGKDNCPDAYVARLQADGAALVYSTYLGGMGYDWGTGLALEPSTGDAVLTGATRSEDFPTTPGAFDRTCGTDGKCNSFLFSDAFVARIGSSPAAYYYVYPDSGQAQAGVPFDLYVFALDTQFHVIPDYTGLILFWATDPEASTPVYYQYQRTDRGVAYFPGGLTFNTPDFQELYVFDWPGIQVFGYAAFDVR